MFLFLLVLTVITFWLGYNAGMLQSSVAHRSYKENCDVLVSKLKEEAIKSASNNYKLKSNIEITRNNHNDECSIKGINRPCSQETLKLEFSPGTYSLNTIFDKIHHPNPIVKNELYLTNSVDTHTWKKHGYNHVNASCKELYLTRAGARGNQPNKCTAVVAVTSGGESNSQVSHRWGKTARLVNQNMNDFSRDYTRAEENSLLGPLLPQLSSLISQIIQEYGDPIDPTTKERRTAIVMVANMGVLDLLLNFICSAREIKIDLSALMVFVGRKEDVNLVNSMGAKAFFIPQLGNMPKKAAGNYLDKTFSQMMWFKTTSVYLATAAGFNVLFQDTDLVWLKNPIPYLQNIPEDVAFMDDGARTPRYTPFFTNSGFYYMKYNLKTLFFQEKMLKASASEIGYTHSHQSVLIRHLVESHHLIGLQVLVLDQKAFPSGQMYHHNKGYMKTVRDGTYVPHVFHMCWTANRKDKVRYFKELGYWHLPDDDMSCIDGNQMQSWAQLHPDQSTAEKCCRAGVPIKLSDQK